MCFLLEYSENYQCYRAKIIKKHQCDHALTCATGTNTWLGRSSNNEQRACALLCNDPV